MDADALSKQLIASPSILPSLVAWLAKEDAAALVDHLKSEADRHWWINANRSLELAELIVRIGQARGDPWQVALGTMARGDALKLLGRTGEAWETLGRAGDLFQKCGDEVGWARTRIGRVGICVDLNRVAEALAEAARARDILGRHGMHEKRLVLDLNTAVVYNLLGDQRQTLSLYRQALATAEALGEIGQQWVAPLYGNIGNAYYLLGDFRQATAYQEHALTLFRDRHNTSACAITELNLAQIAIAQGHYQRALDLLHRAHDLKITLQIPLDAAHIKRQLVECYLLLNRYAEARDLAQQAGAEFHSFGAAYEEALTLLHLAIAEAELANFPAAQAALDAAEPIFASLGAATWVATARLRRGRIALRRGDPAMARHEAMAAITCFQTKGQIIDYATATLLLGQALATESNLDDALEAGKTALHIAQHQNVPAIRYTAHLLLGQVAEAHGDLQRAARQYRAAAATVEHVQRNLTITLRPGFLEDKGEALQALLRLQLRSGAAERAFETLERAKSHVLLNYLANREQLHWAHDDARSRTLIEQLNRLREEHQWFYRLAHEPPVDEESRRGGVDPQQALAEVAARERQMRAITEQLYLHNGEQGAFAQVNAPRLREVRASLDEQALIVEYYNDGANLWAFTLDADTLEVHHLPTTVEGIDRLIVQLQINLDAALGVGPDAPMARGLANIASRILQRLHAALVEPFAQRLRGRRRLVIVPYGALHYLPFHLLRTESAYLIEQFEVVVLPAAGLITRRGPMRAPGALALAHSWDGRLPQTIDEARTVQRLFGGVVRAEDSASRAALRAPPAQILHIAAHGEHRLDQPDLSYIQLADGQMFADDLLQHDLSYELVTLSACETGRAHVAAGDELIGLGRGFLYAGAGALLVSLWRVADDSTVVLMEHIYRALHTGASKAAALRQAQRAILAERPGLHPAFWGAFQLVGDSHPLSSDSMPLTEKEQLYVRAAATA